MVALVLTLGIGYITTVASLEKESIAALRRLMESRVKGESRTFTRAEDNVKRLKAELLARLDERDPTVAEEEFHRLFSRFDDGLWRVRPDLQDVESRPTLYLQHDVTLDTSIYQRAVVSYQLLSERGPAIVPPYYSVYMDFVECGLMVYSPHVDWGGNATRKTDNFNYPTMTGSMPENNPDRLGFWTPVYFDEEAGIWMVSVIEPLDRQGEWVGTVGHDVAIDELMETTLNESLAGTYNIILSPNGQLIVHPEFTERIREAKGDLSLANLNDSLLNNIARLASELGGDQRVAVVEDAEKPYWYGISIIDGPDWYLVTVYPKHLKTSQVLRALVLPSAAGFLIILLSLAFLRWVVQKTVMKPLSHIDKAVMEMTQGESVQTVPIETDDEFGRLARSFEYMTDSLQQREHSLDEARRDWERTFEAVPEMIAILEADGTVKRANKSFLDRHGVSIDECLKKKRSELLPYPESKAASNALEKMLADGGLRRCHHISESLDGEFEVVQTPIYRATGELMGIVEMARDITEQRNLEDKLRHAQKLEAVGKLAGGVAHDFNNLLHVILGYCEVLLHATPPDNENYVPIIETQKAAGRAAVLTQQLLAFSRRQVIVTKPLDVREIVQDTVNMVERLIGEHIELKYIPAATPAIANVDRNQIEQVVVNLCVNARDAMPDGGTLTIRVGKANRQSRTSLGPESSEDGDLVHLSVTDSGCGIPEDVRDRIFEPFFTTKDVHKGTGLGLSTVYGIVSQHHGEVLVHSEEGQGATFDVYLPTAEADEFVALEKRNEPVQGGDECILVAEDDEQIQALVHRILSDAGYRVLMAGDGREAIDLYHLHVAEVDLLLLDVIMPKIGGRVVLETIQKHRPDIPCLFASGYSENALHTDFELHESLHLIEKPYVRQDLLRRIRCLLDG